MGRMFCFWCETGTIPRNLDGKGYIWLHLKCFQEITELKDDIASVKEILAGRKNETIEGFLERMRRFDAHFDRLERIIKEGR